MTINRRNFVIGILASSSQVSASSVNRPAGFRRIGVLLAFAKDDPEAIRRVEAFGSELREKGWLEGDNLEIDYRFAAGNPLCISGLVKELMRAKIEVLVTNTYRPIIDAVAQSLEVSIIFAMLPDPLQSGLFKSVSRPDANITGFMTFEFSIVGKWVELLMGAVPRTKRAVLFANPDTAMYRALGYWPLWLKELVASCDAFAIEPIAIEVRSVEELHRRLAGLPAEASLLIAPDGFTVGNHRRIVAAALERKLPACFPYRYFATEGGLMSYGPNGVHMFRQAASYADRILRGAKASELPIQRPTNLELVVNCKTARALELELPQALVARADELIE